MNPPEGLTTRALTIDDAASVTAVTAADEVASVGEVQIELADVVSDWQRPSFDISTSTVGVFDADQLVGCAEISGPDRADVAVHPDHHGRGIGTWLASWVQQCARGRGASVVGMPVPAGSTADSLLESLGFHVRWTSWVLELPKGTVIPERALPAGLTLRPAVPEDHRAAWTVLEDAFLEWSERERETFADFTASVLQRPGFDPWQLRVVVDAGEDVVAVAHVITAGDCAYVDRLAVRRDQRSRGIAQALLADAFAAARAHGARRQELSTDSRTGALGLYERVGMVVTSTWHNRAVSLLG